MNPFDRPPVTLPRVNRALRVITIDGPAGTGKSSAARRLAARLGLAFLDTGAMYRAIALLALEAGLDPETGAEATTRLAEACRLDFDFAHDPPRLLADGRDVTDALRGSDVTAAVSGVAAVDGVRRALVAEQRAIARRLGGLVTEGRDQGSVVFPDAPFKFYLDAAPEVRARRRAEELEAAGERVDREAMLSQILGRDARDRARRTGPLTCPPDAIRVDTSTMTLDDVVAALAGHVRAREAALR